ncbi:MAG: serine hydrolase [Anaerolineae bacterium]|nr:serine hydrolase [Gloeobacterales cyanobacterium ES-bin-313]
MKRVLLILCGFLCISQTVLAAPTLPKIIDDPQLDVAIAEVRSQFLATQTFKRLDVVLLLPNKDGSWRRGSYHPDALAYPASCVKLAYMVSAIHWCSIQKKAPNCLDAHVRPMVVDSDNVETGIVVDTIAGAPNFSAFTPKTRGYAIWLDKRLYTEKYLQTHGLLGKQRIYNKTYPSNSGESPSRAEQVATRTRGRNLMNPRLSASLMLAIITGTVEPQATAYMRELLVSPNFDVQSSFGFGLPPGSINENKIGLAYDTLEDIAHIVLPNGQELILAAFSDGWNQKQPEPYDGALLGGFAELLIERLGLDTGSPPKLKFPATTATQSGEWTPCGTGLCSPRTTSLQTLTWNLKVPQTGRYEVTIWYPESPDYATDAPFTIVHSEGATTVRLNQQVWGNRWVKLGDFNFDAGQGNIVLSNQVTQPSHPVSAAIVKITAYPSRK